MEVIGAGVCTTTYTAFVGAVKLSIFPFNSALFLIGGFLPDFGLVFFTFAAAFDGLGALTSVLERLESLDPFFNRFCVLLLTVGPATATFLC